MDPLGDSGDFEDDEDGRAIVGTILFKTTDSLIRVNLHFIKIYHCIIHFRINKLKYFPLARNKQPTRHFGVCHSRASVASPGQQRLAVCSGEYNFIVSVFKPMPYVGILFCFLIFFSFNIRASIEITKNLLHLLMCLSDDAEKQVDCYRVPREIKFTMFKRCKINKKVNYD